MAEQDVVEVMARAMEDRNDSLSGTSSYYRHTELAHAALTALEQAGYAVVKKKAEIVNFGGCTDGPYVPLAFGPNGETLILDQVPESTGDRYTVTPIESETFTIDLLPDDPFKK